MTDDRALKQKILIGNRLAQALAAKGLNMKEASLKAGLSETYARDLIRRHRGKLEGLEILCQANGISLQFVRTGKGEIDAPTIVHHASSIDTVRLIESMRTVFSTLGVPEAQAAELALAVLESSQDTKSFHPSDSPALSRALLRSLILKSFQE